MPTKFASNYSRSSSGPTRDQENFRKLQQFEAAEQNAAETDYRTRRLSQMEDKTAFEQAFKLAEADRKAAMDAEKLAISEQRIAGLNEQRSLEQKSRELVDMKREIELQDKARKADDIKGFLKATYGLREDAEDFEKRIDDAMVMYPNALQDEFIQKRMGWLTGNRDKYRERTRLQAEAAKANLPLSQVTADGMTYKADDPKPEKPDTYEQFNKDLEEAKKTYTTGPLPSFLQKYFEDRGRKLEQPHRDAEKAPAGAAGPVAEPVAAVPTLTDKAQFDALPSGAFYIRDGKRFQKP